VRALAPLLLAGLLCACSSSKSVTANQEWIETTNNTNNTNKEEDNSDSWDSCDSWLEAAADAIKKCRRNLERMEAGLKLLEEDGHAAEALFRRQGVRC